MSSAALGFDVLPLDTWIQGARRADKPDIKERGRGRAWTAALAHHSGTFAISMIDDEMSLE